MNVGAFVELFSRCGQDDAPDASVFSGAIRDRVFDAYWGHYIEECGGLSASRRRQVAWDAAMERGELPHPAFWRRAEWAWRVYLTMQPSHALLGDVELKDAFERMVMPLGRRVELPPGWGWCGDMGNYVSDCFWGEEETGIIGPGSPYFRLDAAISLHLADFVLNRFSLGFLCDSSISSRVYSRSTAISVFMDLVGPLEEMGRAGKRVPNRAIVGMKAIIDSPHMFFNA